METVAFCEIDPGCQKILKKHWPKVDIFEDITELGFDDYYGFNYENKIGAIGWNKGDVSHTQIDLICGGYPCTGHSVAGKKKGLENEASGLWNEYLRLIKEIRPKYCIIENSPNLRNTGLGQVLKDVHEIGYNAEWSIVSAYSIGAPHQRSRIYIVLWRNDIPYCNPFRWWEADPLKKKTSQGWWAERRIKRASVFKQASKIESRVCQFDDGIPKELVEINDKKIQMLGNAVVPQIPELIGRAIMENERRTQ